MKFFIDICKNKLVSYPEQNTLNFENVANITADSDSITPQKKKMGDRKISRKIVIFFSTKIRKIRV